MSAAAAAAVTFVAIVAITVVVMAVLFLVKRVQALKVEVQGMSDQLDPALQRLQGDAEVTRTELAAIQDALGEQQAR